MESKIITGKKRSAIFLFENKYRHHTTFTDQTAIVRLEIDYSRKNYSITPNNGTSHFTFSVSSHQNAMWKAVTKGIDQAIDFANEELKNL